MNLQAKKLELVQLILNTEKPSLLQKVEELLKEKKTVDWADDISDALREELEASIKEADRGETISHEEAMVQIRSRYNL